MASLYEDLHIAVVEIQAQAQLASIAVEVRPLFRELLPLALPLQLADFLALLLAEACDADLVQPGIAILVDLLHRRRVTDEIDGHIPGQAHGDLRSIECQLLNGRRIQIARQHIPQADAQLAVRHKQQLVAIRVCPAEIIKGNTAIDMADHALHTDLAAQHILLRHRPVEDSRRPAAREFQQQQGDGCRNEQYHRGLPPVCLAPLPKTEFFPPAHDASCDKMLVSCFT